MLCIGLILIALPAINCLSCTNYWDYTGDTVKCASTCPAGSNLRNKKCLNSNQYLIGEEVHMCERGWVNSQNSVCCPQSHYIASFSNSSFCAKCNTRPYLAGRICCPGSHYADLTNSSNPKCTPLGKGPCSGLTMKNRFQVCCSGSNFYSLDQQKCVTQSSRNCDSTQRVCCSQGRKLDYVNQQYVCIPNCHWSSYSSFQCGKKYCNTFGQSIAAGPSLRKPQQNFKLSLQKSCCYGKNPSGVCLDSSTFCFKRFINRGWSMCCQAGQYYNIKNQACSDTCAGIILFQFFCIDTGAILNLQSQNGQPSAITSNNYLCNNKQLIPQYPVCCPPNFFINSTSGCQYCYGRIFTTFSNQICCGYNQIYNPQKDACQECNGIVNKDGTLCCRANQYFSYSISGISSCVDICSDQKMYKTNYCCDSIGNSQCQMQGFVSTLCSLSYLIDGACQACPTFCALQGSAAQSCSTPSTKSTCQKICPLGTIYSSEIQTCAACDTSCLQCTQPFDAQFCTKCRPGYVLLQGKCSRCSAECLTCSITINSCQSCAANSSRSIYSNGRCMPGCSNGQYLDISTVACMTCGTNCIECSSSYQSQCTKCHPSNYISSIGGGVCSPCGYGCSLCHLSPNQCYQCQPSLYLTDSQQCANTCSGGYCTYYDASLGHNVCLKCHPSCASCSNQPQNCISCTNSSLYLSDETGLNLCYACIAPCITCSSATSCSLCNSGYYIQNAVCVRCHSKCLTCSAGNDQSCLSCFGQSQLIQGRCIGCSSSCQKCDADTSCLMCKAQYFLYVGSCVQFCPSFTFKSSSKCFDCLVNCSTCLNATICSTCAPTHPYNYTNRCLIECPLNYQPQGTNCIPVKNDTNNNTNNNTDNNNNTHNNTDNNTNNNTNNSNSSVVVKSQQIQMPKSGTTTMTVITTLSKTNQDHLYFYLYNPKTNKKIKLQAKKIATTQTPATLSAAPSTDVAYSVDLPPDYDYKNSILVTSVGGNANSSTYYNGKSMRDFIFYDYTTDPLLGLQYVGLVFTVLIAIYSLITKIKGHFIAEQANTIILHMLNFIQVAYLFKFTQLHQEGMYHFLNGFGFMHFLWFPNFFYSTIPTGFIEYPVEKSLIPDGNFIRNAGGSISFCLVVLVVTGLASIVSYAVYRSKELEQMPQIRKITRIGILAAHITFLNIIFTAFNYLVQPSVTHNWKFTNSCRVGAVITLIIVILLCVGIVFHYYKTYNSDVLEHYYTLREGCQLLMIICQGFIFSFGIGKPLLCLSLILLEAVWLIFNHMLYRFGEGDRLKDHAKFIITSSCIVIAYLFMSLSAQVPWIAITVIVSIVVAVLIFYSSYQIVGLYYGLIFKKDVKDSQPKKSEVQKESASRL